MLGPKGEEYCSRHPVNRDREETSRVNELLQSLLQDGLASFVAGVPIYIPVPTRPMYVHMLTCGHRVEALYKGWKEHGEHPQVKARLRTIRACRGVGCMGCRTLADGAILLLLLMLLVLVLLLLSVAVELLRWCWRQLLLLLLLLLLLFCYVYPQLHHLQAQRRDGYFRKSNPGKHCGRPGKLSRVAR